MIDEILKFCEDNRVDIDVKFEAICPNMVTMTCEGISTVFVHKSLIDKMGIKNVLEKKFSYYVKREV